MNLEKIIKKKLNELKKEYNKLLRENKQDKYNKQLQNIIKILNNIKNEKILLIEDDLLEEVMGSISKPDKDENIKMFKDIQLIMKAKYNNNLKIDLTDSQNQFIHKVEIKLLMLKDKLEKKLKDFNQIIDNNRIDELEVFILELEYLFEKITCNKKELLNEKDFNLLYENIIEDENIDYEYKRDLLIEFKRYNSNLENKQIVSIDKVINCFEKYDLTELINIAKQNEDLVNTKANINSINEILKIFKEKNWLDKFNHNTLFTMLLFGDADYIKETVQMLETDVKYKKLFFKTASFWINNISKRRSKSVKNSNKKTHKINPYITAAHEISYEEFLENERFLSDLGFNVSSNSETNMKTLKTPNHRIKENLYYYRLYEILTDENIKDFPASALAFSSVDDKCDIFIELGLLHGKSNYLKKSPTAINVFSDDVFRILYKLKKETTEDLYYKIIMSEHIKDAVKAFVYKDKMGYDLNSKESKEKFFNENFIDYKKLISNSEYLEENILNNKSSIIDQEIFKNEHIRNLDTNFKESEFVYKFGNQIISRYKVLRSVTALKKAKINISTENIIYCIVRNSYIDEKTYNLIVNSVEYSIGEMRKWTI